jgi:hypothetical protein
MNVQGGSVRNHVLFWVERVLFWAFSSIVIVSLTPSLPAGAQSTASAGNVQGTITDPTGAVVAGALVVLANHETGQALRIVSSSSGVFTSGALSPGSYDVRVEAAGFQSLASTVEVQVGVTASWNPRLEIGEKTEVIKVDGSRVQVNTEQTSVQGVLHAEQIDNLPINGRNFLDLAQLEPGVQIQDASDFGQLKGGFSSISIGGRFGRTARIEVDGIDISDETEGTTTQNIPAGAIQEFQVSQSSLDLSTELTSSGAVNVVTRSGTNNWHGEGFYLFRDHSVAAHLGDHDIPFQRNQFGGRLGGPVVKNKLFFFADAERVKQDQIDQVVPAGDFSHLAGQFNAPFRDTNGIARLDWQIKPDNYRVFYRFSYEQNGSVRTFIPNSFQPYSNVTQTPVHAVGLDFNTGSFTHAIRFGYTMSRSTLGNAVNSNNMTDPLPGIELAIGFDPLCLFPDVFCSGPTFLAPEKSFQANHQIKYDGSKIIGSHILRFGAGYNHILGGGFSSFLGLAPAVSSLPVGVPTFNAFPGGDSNPLNYPAQTVFLGNGIGFSSEKPAFGLPGGGQGPDNRLLFYAGDSWKLRSNLLIAYGLRYVRDTGRTDSDIAPIPCSALNPMMAARLNAAGTQCTSNILDMFGPGLGDRIRQPNLNFAPQLGFTWDPTKAGKTVVRGGAGLYFENSIFINNSFDRPARVAQGSFLVLPPACVNGFPVPVPLPTGQVVFPTFCGQPIGQAAPAIMQLQQQLQAATAAAGPSANVAFIGNTLSSIGANVLFAPNSPSPRSVQMNIGIEREIRKGMVFTADYVRNVETHTLQGVDVNHVGDARFFNRGAAQTAIATTLHICGAGTIDAAIASCPTLHPAGGGATMADFILNGLGSGIDVCGGLPCPNAAFGGKNPNLGELLMLFRGGRSVYNGLQTSLRADVARPIKGIRNLNWQASYSLSRFDSTARDGDFFKNATDNNNPTSFFGPNSLDRTHQFSFGGFADLPGSLRFGLIGHFYSPLPLTITLPTTTASIFSTDVTGDGTAGDILPGTNVGSFGRGVSAGSLNAVIGKYNGTMANKPTPAGAMLVQSGLMTQAQLQALGGVQQPLPLAPRGQVGLDWLRALDMKLSWPKRIRESVNLEPSISFFNALNFANFDSPTNALSGVLNGAPGSANGTTIAMRNSGAASTRIGVGSGVFAVGSPRVVEFGLKLGF